MDILSVHLWNLQRPWFQKSSDFTITVQQKQIFVHKKILKKRSKYFEAMFQESWGENIKK